MPEFACILDSSDVVAKLCTQINKQSKNFFKFGKIRLFKKKEKMYVLGYFNADYPTYMLQAPKISAVAIALIMWFLGLSIYFYLLPLVLFGLGMIYSDTFIFWMFKTSLKQKGYTGNVERVSIRKALRWLE